MKQKKVIYTCQAAIIAALYVILTFIGPSSGAIQLRLSEALTVLPFFTPAAIPGLAVGCFFGNWFAGCTIPDIVFGTLATVIGAIFTYLLRRYKWLAPVPPILANTIIVPWVLRLSYGLTDAIPYMMLTVGIGEVLSCGVLGIILLISLEKLGKNIFDVN